MTPDDPKDSPQREMFTARLTPEAKRRLMALSQILQRPAYLVLEDAFSGYWEELPVAQKRAVLDLIDLVDRARDRRS